MSTQGFESFGKSERPAGVVHHFESSRKVAEAPQDPERKALEVIVGNDETGDLAMTLDTMLNLINYPGAEILNEEIGDDEEKRGDVKSIAERYLAATRKMDTEERKSCLAQLKKLLG